MSGLIGRALRPELEKRGCEIVRLKSGAAREPNEIAWDPLRPLEVATVGGFDAVIHLEQAQEEINLRKPGSGHAPFVPSVGSLLEQTQSFAGGVGGRVLWQS